MVPAYHGDATKHREQTKVEGAHASESVTVLGRRIVNGLNTNDGMIYLRQ